jgi:hypothetical protein
MTKHLDKGKVESALKRAARAAVSGNREARAGKFIPRDTSSGRISGEKNHDKGDTKR